jgi:MOSC domain-containing protein YiiM
MVNAHAYLDSIYVGGPKRLTDDQGEWQSSIYRDRMDGPMRVEMRGLVGDQATQPYHGSSECAICCHLLDHYRFWNVQYGMNLEAGNVGENFALEQITEDEVCIGDMYRVGAALVQVSAPRIPCANQARRIGRADWARLSYNFN